MLSVVLIVDVLENGQAAGGGDELLKEGSLVTASGVEALKDVHVRRVVVSVKLEEGSVFMSEHAVRAFRAYASLIESPAVVGLEFVAVAEDSSRGELVLCMSKPTLVIEPALGRLDPVAAELCLLVATVGQWHREDVHGLTISIEVVLVGDTLSATLHTVPLGGALENVFLLLG